MLLPPHLSGGPQVSADGRIDDCEYQPDDVQAEAGDGYSAAGGLHALDGKHQANDRDWQAKQGNAPGEHPDNSQNQTCGCFTRRIFCRLIFHSV